MVGCPSGIMDEINNLPIFRRGISSSSIGKLYNGKPEFLIDMACFPGSSGSPVYIFNQGSYPQKNGGIVAGTRIFLVGILYRGPLFKNTGHVKLGQGPTVTVDTMMHLGQVIRSTELLIIGDLAKKSF